MVVKHIQIYGVHISRKCICKSKKTKKTKKKRLEYDSKN